MVLGRFAARLPVLAARSANAAPASRAALSARAAVSASLLGSHSSVLPAFRFGAAIQVRNSTKHASGNTRNGRKSYGKRLGPKKLGGAKVRTSNVLFRQRGTKWHAGENVVCGRDHTLNAKIPGFVQYYTGAPEGKTNRESRAEWRAYRFLNRKKDTSSHEVIAPLRMRTIYHELPRKRSHPTSRHTYRRYMGIALTREQTLPVLKGESSPRLLNYARAGVREPREKTPTESS